MKIMKFVVKMVLALVLMAFGGLGWYLTVGTYFDRMRKTISAKRAKEIGSKCHPISYAKISKEERSISAKNYVESAIAGWKWLRKA